MQAFVIFASAEELGKIKHLVVYQKGNPSCLSEQLIHPLVFFGRRLKVSWGSNLLCQTDGFLFGHRILCEKCNVTESSPWESSNQIRKLEEFTKFLPLNPARISASSLRSAFVPTNSLFNRKIIFLLEFLLERSKNGHDGPVYLFQICKLNVI